MAEEIIDRLSRIRSLRVVARSSSSRFKGSTEDLREIGRQLNATAVVEGSVRRSGEKLRVTAQLVNVADGFQIWSETYERQTKEVFHTGGNWEPGAIEYGLLGAPEKARAAIAAWPRFHEQRHIFVAYAYAVLGDTDNAAIWLERACEERDPQVVWAKVDPRLAKVRQDPRIQAVIRKIGL